MAALMTVYFAKGSFKHVKAIEYLVKRKQGACCRKISASVLPDAINTPMCANCEELHARDKNLLKDMHHVFYPLCFL